MLPSVAVAPLPRPLPRRLPLMLASVLALTGALAVDLDLVSAGRADGASGPAVVGATEAAAPAPPVEAGPPALTVHDPERRALAPILDRWADAHDLPDGLLPALAWRESRWDNARVSPDGAVGIGQVLPTTAAWVNEELIGAELDPAHPEENIRLSARYLAWLLERSDGDPAEALAAYHQGPASVREHGPSPQTAGYVDDVLALQRQFTS